MDTQFQSENFKESFHFGEMFKRMLGRVYMCVCVCVCVCLCVCGLDLTGSRRELVAGYCERSNGIQTEQNAVNFVAG
jgi:hypothetical protein